MIYERLKELRAPRSSSAQSLRLVVPIVVLAVCFCLVCAWILLDSYRSVGARATEGAESVLAAIEADTKRTIEGLDLSLLAVVEGLRQPEIDRISPELRQVVLFDRSATASHVGAITVLDAGGTLTLDSHTTHAREANFADRDYFLAQRERNDVGLFISAPIKGRFTRRSIFVLSRRLSNADGSFAGVAVGSIVVDSLLKTFMDASLGKHGTLTLARADGTVLMRWPESSDQRGEATLTGTELWKHFTEARRGQLVSPGTSDGIRRLFVYSQVGDLPLVVTVGQPISDIYSAWKRQAIVMGGLTATLCLLTVALAFFLNRELKRRSEIEAKLSILATTDGLTGLANRHNFDVIEQREWQRALRERTSLALLMIDADHFKAYNDLRGHQAGDELLRLIATAISATTKRPTDIGARYGGDEFAVLLPGTQLDGAARTAKEIRERYLDLCRERDIALGEACLSIGVAAMRPRHGVSHGELLAAADKALYRAKELGRNRTEVSVPGAEETARATRLAAIAAA